MNTCLHQSHRVWIVSLQSFLLAGVLAAVFAGVVCLCSDQQQGKRHTAERSADIWSGAFRLTPGALSLRLLQTAQVRFGFVHNSC